MTVLPKGYTEPDTSNYMKFKQGDNKFRALSDKITVGMEFWKATKDGREPVRRRPDEPISPKELEVDKEGQLIMPKHFWAFVVWNYNSKKVQILEITQATIRRKLNVLMRNEDWGDLAGYDITVTKEGEGFDTTYETVQSPKIEVDPGIARMAKDMKINVDALFEGKNPFKSEDDVSDVPGDLK